jgi:probable F420-dependent oxidoreductase
MPRLDRPAHAWRDDLRRIEDLGFATVAISDHVTHGWVMDPLVAMTAAAAATTRLRVLSLLLSNDYRHPAFVHKAAATLDVLSGGRVELGLGAGWMVDDYEATGLSYDPAAVRVDRLEESLEIVTSLFGPKPVTFVGKHYRIVDLDGLPKPAARPPLLVGGGGRRVLELAGRLADIAGINPVQGRGRDAVDDMSPDRITQKVAWVRGGAVAAGRDPDGVELQLSMLRVAVDGSDSASSLFSRDRDDNAAAQSPAVLVGPVAACIDRLHEIRELYGISYFHLGGDVNAVAPVVAALAGT